MTGYKIFNKAQFIYLSKLSIEIEIPLQSGNFPFEHKVPCL